MKRDTEQKTVKAPNELSNVFFIAHLLPIGLFTTAIFCGIFLVTACGPTKPSTLKNPPLSGVAPQNPQQTSGALSTVNMSGQDLIKKLSGFWDCVIPANPPSDSDADCYGENITFSPALDQLTFETMIPQDNGGSCHVQIVYKTTAQVQSGGVTLLNMTDTQSGKLLDDPANATDCASNFSLSLNMQQDLTHNADWSQITFMGVTYARPAPAKSAATSIAETWTNP